MTKNSKGRRFSNQYFKFLTTDIIIVGLSFLLLIWLKPSTVDFYLPHYFKPFLLLLFVWLMISTFLGKYRINSKQSLNDIYVIITFSNITIIAIITSLLFFFNRFGYSRLIVFGTVFISSILEYLVVYIYFSIVNANLIDRDFITHRRKVQLKEREIRETFTWNTQKLKEGVKEYIISHYSKKVFNFIDRNLNDYEVYINKESKKVNVDNLISSGYKNIVDFYQINNIYQISSFFSSLNMKMELNGLYVGRVETHSGRKQYLLSKFPVPINHINYFFDYILTRVIPKLLFTRGIYFLFFKRKERVLSKAETFGRLYASGFEIVDELESHNELFFIARKIKSPTFDKHPSYGFLISLSRYGKNGKLFKVYKIRTMHAYAEYLQEYIYNKNKLQEGGKFKNDFRITKVGRTLRKYWIDELPMVISLITGDMKLVGVRPLSEHYFNLYSEELKEKRIKNKPGLIPPFYVDLPKSLEEIMESECKYLDAYEKAPFLTDWNYFWKVIYNIFVKKVRGK